MARKPSLSNETLALMRRWAELTLEVKNALIEDQRPEGCGWFNEEQIEDSLLEGAECRICTECGDVYEIKHGLNDWADDALCYSCTATALRDGDHGYIVDLLEYSGEENDMALEGRE